MRSYEGLGSGVEREAQDLAAGDASQARGAVDDEEAHSLHAGDAEYDEIHRTSKDRRWAGLLALWTVVATKLQPGDAVWWVQADEWPHYSVVSGCYVGPVEGMSAAAQLELAEGHGAVVALARVFISEEAAEQEAGVLQAFAGGPVMARALTTLL